MNKSLVQQQFGAHAAAYATSSVHAKGASLGRLVELVQPPAVLAGARRGHRRGTHGGGVRSARRPRRSPATSPRRCCTEAAKLPRPRGSPTWRRRGRCRGAAIRGCALRSRHLPHRAAPLPRYPDLRGRGLARAEARRHVRAGRQHRARYRESTPGFSSTELRDAALTYNAFEKIRDPSHGRCLGMAEWSEVIRRRLRVAARSACPRTWSSSRGRSAWAPTPRRSSGFAPC